MKKAIKAPSIKKMSMSIRRDMKVDEAIKRVGELGVELEKHYRSKKLLEGLLVEVILIAEAWRSQGQRLVSTKKALLMCRVENKGGQRGELENLLLRASLESILEKPKKTAAWARACFNLANHMKMRRIDINKANVAKELSAVGIDRARLGEFGNKTGTV